MKKVIIIVAALTACAKHNPDACCTSPDQCQRVGLDQMYACAGGKVCDLDGACIAPQCATSADCTSPDAAICVGQLCVPSCTMDVDCSGMAGRPYCASDGTCVACVMDSQCTPDAPVCDQATHSCRGCTRDAECPDNLCLEADGTCASESQAAYVFAFGTDSGTCSKSAPCATLGYALGQTKSIIHIDGSNLSLGSATLTIGKPVYIDATNTTLSGGPSSGAAIAISVVGQVTLGNVVLSPAGATAVSVGSSATLRLFGSSTTGTLSTSNGAIAIVQSKFDGASGAQAVSCTSGTVSVETSSLTNVAWINSQNCDVTVRKSRFETGGPTVTTMGGKVTVEDNLFVETVADADSMSVQTAAPGTTVRFNTFVNTAAVSADGAALACDATVDATSNIFAYGSMHPNAYSPTCPTRYSLYDTVALAQYTTGQGDRVGDATTFFKDAAHGDYHLAANSPALMSGEPGLAVSEDLDGNPRPSPSGTPPDIGAFESP